MQQDQHRCRYAEPCGHQSGLPLHGTLYCIALEKTMQPFVLQLYSTKPFDGHFSFEDLGVGLLAVTGKDDSMRPSAAVNGKPVFYLLDEMPEFFAKTGRNTAYVLHPEEISAEHFALWVVGATVPQPEYFDALKAVLAKGQ